MTGERAPPNVLEYGRLWRIARILDSEIIEVLVDSGGFEWRRTTGDHAQRYYRHPTNEEDRRHVTVPLHDELDTGTLRSITKQAGAHDFDAFYDWIDYNRCFCVGEDNARPATGRARCAARASLDVVCHTITETSRTPDPYIVPSPSRSRQ